MSNGKPTLKDIVNYANTMVDKETGLAYDTSDVAPSSIKGDLGFEPLNKYDEGLKRGMNQEDVRAFNQPNYKAIGNSLVQLVTGTIGDLVGSPGYAYEGLQSIASANDEFDNMFIKAGEWIKELGTDNFPIYTDQASRDTVFNPFDGEWIANSIAQFGPTMAMLGASFATEGLLYPALASRLSKIPAIGKYLGAAENFIQGNNIAKTARMAFTSRAIEGGMEAFETFNSTYEQLKRENPELSDEEAKKKAGEAASRVYSHNWILAATDFLEFKGILSGFGMFGKTGSLLKGLGSVGFQAGTEALEEGVQYAIAQEAKAEVQGRKESTIVSEFIDGLGDTEMQQAMVQGALGGAIFTAAGKVMDKLVNNYAKAKKASPAELTQLLTGASLEAIKRHANEGRLESYKKQTESDLAKPNITPEEKAHGEKMLEQIDYYQQLHESVEESDPDVKQAKIDSLFKQRFLSDQSEIALGLTPEETKATLKERIKNAKHPKVKEELQKQLNEIPEDVKAAKLDPIQKKKAKEQAKLEDAIQNEKDIEASLNTKKGREDVIKQKQQEAKQFELDQYKTKVQKYTSPADFERALQNNETEAVNKTEKANILKEEIDKRANEELNNQPPPTFKNEEEVKEFYKDKPFAAYKEFGTSNIESPQSNTNVKIGDAFEYTTTNGNTKRVKIVGENRGMFIFEDESGKTFRKDKDVVRQNVGNNFRKTEQFDEAEVVENETVIDQPKTIDQTIQEQVEDNSREVAVTDDIVTSEEEEPTQKVESPNSKNSTYAKVFDQALFRYDKAGFIYITNHFGGKEVPIDKAREQYTIPKNLEHNEYYILKDKDGFPIESGYIKNIDDYDVNIIRELYKYTDYPVYVEINNNDKYNSDKDHTQIRMEYAIYINGQRKVIGIVPADNKDDIQRIRKQVFDENTGEGIYQYSLTTSIDKITGSHYNTHSDPNKRQNPSSVIPEDMPLIIGVGYTIGEQMAGAEVKYNFDSGKLDPVIRDFIKANNYYDVNQVGKHIYIASRDVDGNIVPVRVYTKPVKSMPELKQQLLQAINTFDVETARDIIKFNYINAKGEKKSTPDFDSKLAKKYGNVKATKENAIPGSILAIKDGNGGYKFIARINEDNTYSVLDNNLNETEVINKLPTDQGEYYLHYAYNYYQFYEMDNRPLQIDHKKVNTGNYNAEVANERLLSDLIPGSNFSSPRFSVDLNSLDKSAIKIDQAPNLTAVVEEELANRESPVDNIIQVSDTKRVNNGVVEYKKGKNWVAYKNQDSGTAKKILDSLDANDEVEPLAAEQELEVPNNSTVKDEEVSDSNAADINDFLKLYQTPDTKHKRHRAIKLNKHYVVWDSKKESSWFKSLFPNANIDILNPLQYIKKFGFNTWATFTSAGVSIMNSASEGTLYHEAYHIAENVYFTDKQLEAIKKESRKRFSAPTKSDIQDLRKLYPKMSEEELVELYYEEARADAFMNYKLAQELELQNVSNSLGSRLKRFFKKLYDFIKFSLQNKVTLDKLFWQLDTQKLTKKQFARDISNFTPRHRRSSNYTPTQYQEILDFTAVALDNAIQQFEQETGLEIKDIVNNHVIPTGKTNLSQLSDNLIFSNQIPYSVINQVLAQYNTITNQEDVAGEYTKLLQSLVNIDPKTGNVKFKQLTYDVLKNLSTRGIIITVSNNVQEESIGQPEEETDFYDENEDFREGWQAKFSSVSAYERIGQKLRFILNGIPVLKWTNKEEGQYEEVEGYLGFTKTYTSNYVYNQLQPIIGNATDKQNMIDKLKESDHILAAYIRDNLFDNEVFMGQLWIGVSQKNHPIFVSLLHEVDNKKTQTKAVSSNSNTILNKITENIIASFVSFNPIYNEDGTINTDKAQGIKKDFDAFKKEAEADYKKHKSEAVSIDTINKLHDLLGKYNIDIPLEILQAARDNKYFAKVVAGSKTSSIYNFIEVLAKGKDPLESGNTGIRDFLKPLRSYYPNDVQSAHKNPSGGQVYEWIDANYLGRTIHQLKNGTHIIDFHQNDPYYAHSPLLNLIKNSHNKEVKASEYEVSPDKINYVIYSEMKLDGYTQAKEYSNMSERELYLSVMMGYYNSNNHDGTAIFPLPVHSDSPAMTGIKIPIIKNINYKKSEKGLIQFLNDVAYQEFVRVKLNRTGIKNQDKYTDTFLYFDILETDTFKSKKAKLLTLDFNNAADRKEIRSILDSAVKEQLKQNIKKETDRMLSLNIIKEVNGNLYFVDNLLDNKPVKPFIEHFVANFMFHQHQFATIFNGDLSFYKDIGDFYKRAKQIWSPGTYLDTTKTRKTYNVKYENTNYVTKDDASSSYANIVKALNILYPKEIAARLSKYYEKVDETDAQSYIDLFRYREQQKGLWRWNDNKEAAYERLMQGEYNLKDINVIFNVNKPFYYGKHLLDNQIIPVQNKNSEFIILPAFAKKSNPFYNSEYKRMLEEMGYEFDAEGNVTTTPEELERKRTQPDNQFIDQIAFDTAIKVGYEPGVHKYNNSDWRLQMETPAHHLNDEVVFATQLRKHMMNDLDLTATYTLPDGTKLTGEEWLTNYNKLIIDDVKRTYEQVVAKFDNFNDLIDTLREEVISRDLGDQYLQALDYFVNDIGELETKLPLWHPLHLYRIEAMLNSMFTKKVSTQKLSSGVTLANLSSYGFKDKPIIKFKDDGSLDYMEAYVPIYDEKFFNLADENGIVTIDAVKEAYGEDALRGVVWRIPNEDKYSTFNIRIKGFLPKESGGAIVLPPEVTAIAGLD